MSGYGSTRKDSLLESVVVGVTTWMRPLLAPAGTVAAISVPLTTVNEAAMPSNVTLVLHKRR
jgi:hypothetical protein